MTARRSLALGGAALACALVAGRLLAGEYVEWAWYRSLGAESVWAVRLASLAALRVGLFVAGFGFAFGNLLAMRRSIVSLVLPRRLANLEIGEAVPGRALTAAAAGLSVLIAALVSLPQDDWVGLLRAQWALPLGESDPYLNRDFAFWTGWLPFERTLHEWAVTLAVLVAAVLMVLYALTPSVQMQRGRVQVSTWVRRHFAIYSAVLLLLVAWGYRLDSFELLLHGSGAREAFVAFDHHVLYPYLIALSFGTAAVGVLVAWTGWVGHQRATVVALLLVLVVGPLGRFTLPLLDRSAPTARERVALDRPYLHARELYTRRAFRVDEVVRGAAADSLRVPNAALADRVSGWDPAALARAVADEPGETPLPGGIAWRVDTAGALHAQVMVDGPDADATHRPRSVREVDPADRDERGAPWPSRVAPLASVPALTAGIGLASVRVVSDTLGRVAAPSFRAGWRRIALAWGVRTLRLAFGDPETRGAKLLLRRDVRARVQALYPFFTIGATPQAFVARDSLWWSIELFNASSDYPLTHAVELNGAPVRTAVAAGLALVNAHSGRVVALLPDRPDKTTLWWRTRLPSLFVGRRATDPAVLAALPAPVDRATVQGTAVAFTGFRNDTLAVRPLFDTDDADADFVASMATPFVSGAEGQPLALGVPAVDGIERLRGVFVAVGGRDQRTALVEQADTLRWPALLDQLQRAADSAHVSVASRHPRRGHVRVVPTTRGLLLVQSFYDWMPERAPALAGTVTSLEGALRSAPSLMTALGAPGRAVGADARLRERLARVYSALQDALRREDWAAFGAAMAELRKLASVQ